MPLTVGRTEILGLWAGGASVMTAVGLLVAELAPAAFDARTVTRSVLPTAYVPTVCCVPTRSGCWPSCPERR
jgi:hypothetical protein